MLDRIRVTVTFAKRVTVTLYGLHAPSAVSALDYDVERDLSSRAVQAPICTEYLVNESDVITCLLEADDLQV